MCIYVEKITKKEGNKIQSILRRGKDRVAIKRAQVILLSAQRGIEYRK